MALQLVRVLDPNGDGKVTPDEWHKAWMNGDFKVEERDADPADPPDGQATTGKSKPKKLGLSSKYLSSADLLSDARRVRPHGGVAKVQVQPADDMPVEELDRSPR